MSNFYDQNECCSELNLIFCSYKWTTPCYTAAGSTITLSGASGDVFVFLLG